jgi:hypothetical protein
MLQKFSRSWSLKRMFLQAMSQKIANFNGSLCHVELLRDDPFKFILIFDIEGVHGSKKFICHCA